MFLGEFEHSLDAKQRLAFPAEIRDGLKSDIHGESLVAIPGAYGSLWIWPEKTFETMAAGQTRGFVRSQEQMEMDRYVFSRAARLTFDNAGRIRIPDRLLQEFGLKGRVTILCAFDHFELSDADAWKTEFAQASEKGKGDYYYRRLDPSRKDKA